MNQPRDIVKNTAVLAIARLTERASNILLAFFISRMLHASGLGVYSAAMAYYGLIAVASEMGATNLIVREIAKYREETNRYVVHLCLIGGVVSVALMALSMVALPYLGYSAELRASMFVVILAITPGTLSAIQESVFVAHQRVEFVTYTTFVTAIVNVIVSLLLLMYGYAVVSLLIAFIIIQWIEVIFYFYIINRYIATLHWEFSLPFVKDLIREMKAFAASSILGGLLARPEIIILSFVSNESQIGFYSAALKVVDLWAIIPQIYMINVFPVLSRSYHVSDQDPLIIQNKSIKYLLAISLPLAIGTAVAAEPILDLLYGPGFEPSIVILAVLSLTMPLTSLFAVLWRVLAARGQQSLVVRVQVVTIFTRLASGFFLISALAALGAAITIPTNMLLHTLLLALYVKRDGTQLNLFHLAGRFGLAAMGMGGAIWAFGHHMPLWVLVLVSTAIYMTLVVLFRAFSQDDIALFRKVWQSRMESQG